MEIVRGIGLGFGIAIGFVIAVAFIGMIITGIIALYKFSMRNNFSVDLFKLYYRELMREERFEEINDVKNIIRKLKKKEKPKELLQNYRVDVDSYLYWAPTYEGGERLVFRHDKRIVKKPPKPTKDNNNESNITK